MPTQLKDNAIVTEFNNVRVTTQAMNTWGMACDVSIFQDVNHPQIGITQQWIQLSITEAKLLVSLLQRAIDSAECIQNEYIESCEKDSI